VFSDNDENRSIEIYLSPPPSHYLHERRSWRTHRITNNLSKLDQEVSCFFEDLDLRLFFDMNYFWN